MVRPGARSTATRGSAGTADAGGGLEALDGLGLRVRKGERLTSVVATLEGAPGPSILLRATWMRCRSKRKRASNSPPGSRA
jgi:hypothetical protein